MFQVSIFVHLRNISNRLRPRAERPPLAVELECPRVMRARLRGRDLRMANGAGVRSRELLRRK